MAGIMVRDQKHRSTVRLVPVMNHPRKEPIDCNTCNMVHVVKTYHLWLDDTGAAIVSPQVLEGLKQAGMPGIDIVGEVKDPPPLAFGYDRGGRPLTRDRVDHNNRKIRFLRKKWK
jgi:hypothetical protein